MLPSRKMAIDETNRRITDHEPRHEPFLIIIIPTTHPPLHHRHHYINILDRSLLQVLQEPTRKKPDQILGVYPPTSAQTFLMS
jgi:hypothetical protein